MEHTYRVFLFDVKLMDVKEAVTASVHVAFRCKYNEAAHIRAVKEVGSIVRSWYGDRAKTVEFVKSCGSLTFLGTGYTITKTTENKHGKS